MIPIRATGQLVKRFGLKLLGVECRCRFKSSISIEPVRIQNTNIAHDKSVVPTQVSNPEALLAHLGRYAHFFPKDTATISQAHFYKDLVRGSQVGQTIKIGIIYADEIAKARSKLVETILADPLSSRNQAWYDPVKSRSRVGLNHFKSIDMPMEHEASFDNIYKVQSPLLSARVRPSFSEALGLARSSDDKFVTLTEINDIKDLESTHFEYLINVATELEQLISAPYSKDVQSKILLNVIDNSEYSPVSSESTPITFDSKNVQSHTIKINSLLAYEGVEQFLRYDTKVATEFIESIQNSNVLELHKAIVLYSKSASVKQWIIESIRSKLQAGNVKSEDLAKVIEAIKGEEINKYSQLVHSELQDQFIPETRRFFKKNLSWWKLYYKNDNVEYDLKDFFSRSFMNKSIERYNYLRGQIVISLQNQKFATYQSDKVASNPLSEMKYQLINQRISSEIQPHVYKSLGRAFTFYQLPISVISFLSYQYFDFSSNAAFALCLLGWVVGFNDVSKSWNAVTSKWCNNLFEEIRLRVSKDCIKEGLLHEVSIRSDEEMQLNNVKEEILKGINEECKIEV